MQKQEKSESNTNGTGCLRKKKKKKKNNIVNFYALMYVICFHSYFFKCTDQYKLPNHLLSCYFPAPSVVPERSELLNVFFVLPRIEVYTALSVSIVGSYLS